MSGVVKLVTVAATAPLTVRERVDATPVPAAQVGGDALAVGQRVLAAFVGGRYYVLTGGSGGGGAAGVSSFNSRTGAVTLSKADVTGTGLSYVDVGADPAGAAAAVLPDPAGNAGKVLTVNAAGTGYELDTPGSGPVGPQFVKLQDSGVLGSSSSLVLTLGQPVAAGNTVLAAVKSGSGVQVSSVTDSRGNAWTLDVHTSGTAATVAVFRCRIVTALQAGDTITATLAGASGGQVVAYEYAGLPALAVDVSANGVAAATSMTLNGPATTASDFAVGVAASGSASTTLACSTGTSRGPAASTNVSEIDFTSLPAGAAVTMNWSGAVGNIAAVYVAYKAA